MKKILTVMVIWMTIFLIGCARDNYRTNNYWENPEHQPLIIVTDGLEGLPVIDITEQP